MQKTNNVKYACYLAASVAFLTFLVYLPALRNEFVNWDDGPYVFANLQIRSFDGNFFKWAFLEFHIMNWHPLTWISHALDYALWGLNPMGHHLTNIILHTVNTALVVVLATKLVEARTNGLNGLNGLNKGALIAAGVAGLLFGLHPVHVESVAWVAERKDLLCALFFLLSVIWYANYVSYKTYRTYMLTLGFFALALMSKPMAITLPAVLLILDWYPYNRIRSLKTFRAASVEKLPFLALSLISSVLTVFAQRSGGALELMEIVPLSTRLLVSMHSLIAYLGKMLWPLELIPFYPYPRTVSFLSPEYFGVVALVIGITIICVVKAKKKQHLWLSVWSYYCVTLAPVLGIIQVGGQAMADRYTYLPSVGPFLLVGLGAAWVWEKSEISWKRGLIATTAFMVFLSLSFMTFQQIGRWKNDVDLWNYVIEREGHDVLFAYFKRGQAFALRGQYEKAIEDYNTVIALNVEEYSKAYIERGLTYLKAGQVDLAVADLKKACSLGDNFGCKALRFIGKQGRNLSCREHLHGILNRQIVRAVKWMST
ncbi:MAG: tetratricopeptide repeat protein [Nitrospirae bacterium]|nr:tetratricopeptide repeat protein [Nitrospirota bacterium]